MEDIGGKVAMITGASRGLGAALALELARAGALTSLCARSAPPLSDFCARIEAEGGRCLGRAVDIRDEEGVARWVAETGDRLGPPEVLVNNASILGSRIPLADQEITEWRNVLDVNLTGALIVSRAVLPRMLERGSGSIVFLSSGAAIPPRRNWGAYGVSKAALDAMALNLAAELEGSGVRVNVVDPGSMRTTMRAAAYPAEDPKSVKDPASIAPLILWLASGESGEVTGRRFTADEWLSAHG